MEGPECWTSIWSLAGWREPSLMTCLADLVITSYQALRAALQSMSFLKDSINIFWVLVLFYIFATEYLYRNTVRITSKARSGQNRIESHEKDHMTVCTE